MSELWYERMIHHSFPKGMKLSGGGHLSGRRKGSAVNDLTNAGVGMDPIAHPSQYHAPKFRNKHRGSNWP